MAMGCLKRLLLNSGVSGSVAAACLIGHMYYTSKDKCTSTWSSRIIPVLERATLGVHKLDLILPDLVSLAEIDPRCRIHFPEERSEEKSTQEGRAG